MTVVNQVLRSQVRCDICKAAYVHAVGDIDAFLTEHDWRVTDGRHECPRCVRRAGEGLGQITY